MGSLYSDRFWRVEVPSACVSKAVLGRNLSGGVEHAMCCGAYWYFME